MAPEDLNPPGGVLSLEATLVWIVALAVPVGIALYSAVHGSIWGSRNLISSWPAFALVLGLIVSCGRWQLSALATALLLVGFGIGGLKMTEIHNRRPDYQAAAAFIDRIDRGDAPVVDLVAPTPGPPTETEAALAMDGGARHPVLRIGLPPLAQVLDHPPYADLPSTPGQVIANDAVKLARHGVLFFVSTFPLSISQLQAVRLQWSRRLAGVIRSGAYPPAAGEGQEFGVFLGALPANVVPYTSRTYPGFGAVTVYAFRIH